MLVDEVIAFAILKALGKDKWDEWTKYPYHFIGKFNNTGKFGNEHPGVKKVIVDSYDKTVTIIADSGVSSSEIEAIHKLLGSSRLSVDGSDIVIEYTW